MSPARPLRVGLLGAGTVGGQVVRAFAVAADRLAVHGGPRLELVGVAVRDLARAQASGIDARLLTDAPAHLVASPATDVIVELMGGDEPARTLIAAALAGGKAVVTANKHVIGHHGPELESIARRSAVALRFEAAVAGGIPVLGPLAAELAADRPRRIRGIVNGTTNFILTAMSRDGRAYADVLAEAQAAGYAEAEPSGDVEGDDAVNKLVILIRLAFGTWVDPADVVRCPPTGDPERTGRPGITGVTTTEIAGAAALGGAIKLVVDGRRTSDGRIEATVVPTLVSRELPLGRIDGVTNRIEIEAEPLGTVAFEGPGAGGAATASAVLGDLLAVGRGGGSTWAGLPPAEASSRGGISGLPDTAPDRSWFAIVAPAYEPGSADRSVVAAPVAGGTAVVLHGTSLAAARERLLAAGMPPEGTILPVAGAPVD